MRSVKIEYLLALSLREGWERLSIVDEYKPAGNYEIEFNSHSGESRNLTSGVYFYQLKTENYIQTKKMILLK